LVRVQVGERKASTFAEKAEASSFPVAFVLDPCRVCGVIDAGRATPF